MFDLSLVNLIVFSLWSVFTIRSNFYDLFAIFNYIPEHYVPPPTALPAEAVLKKIDFPFHFQHLQYYSKWRSENDVMLVSGR